MKVSGNTRWIMAGGGAILLVLLSVACVQLAPRAWPRLTGSGDDVLSGATPQPPDAATAVTISVAPVATPQGSAQGSTPAPGSVLSRQVVAARRGSIVEVVQAGGRVSAPEEVTISFSHSGRVASVAVRPGQPVEPGQLLLETESQDIAKELTAARARLDLSAIRLQEAQARQSSAARQAQAERQRRQDAVAEAEAALRRALAEEERVKAGPPASEREAAEGAVAGARATLERAEADLAKLKAGATSAELRTAEQQVTSARVALQRAEADLARLKAGPNPDEVRAAERDLANAQAAAERAQADLDRLTRGPDPYELRAAERDVERAQNALRAAEAVKADDSTRASRDAAIAAARLGLQDAQERLARLREPAKPADVEAARRKLEAAQADVATARARLDTVRKGPDQLSLDAAQAAVDGARLALDNATARFNELQAGPSADRLAAATTAVETARTSLAIATARLEELKKRPTPAELREAEDRVAAAQATLDRARAEAALPRSDLEAFDLLALQKALEQDRAQVAALERELAETRLLAPVAGTIAAVLVRKGDPVEPDQPVFVLAKPGEPVVRVDLSGRDAVRVAAGQQVTVQLEGATDALSGSVTAITDAPGGFGRIALVAVTWPVTPPPFGTGAHVAITVQEKANALLVPRRAIRSTGARRYVQYLDGSTRRIANVEVGIISGDDAEILSGLAPGQLVVVGP
jgi:HlyD family secretion protein